MKYLEAYFNLRNLMFVVQVELNLQNKIKDCTALKEAEKLTKIKRVQFKRTTVSLILFVNIFSSQHTGL